MKKKNLLKICSIGLSAILLSNTLIYASAADQSQRSDALNAPIADLAWKSKIDNDVLEMMETQTKEKSSEKLKVYVWYKDINQAEVTQEIEARTGLTYDAIDTDLEMPDAELLSDFAQLYADDFNNAAACAEFQEEMQSYMQETQTQRAEELRLTDEWVETERKVAREAYIEKGDEILEELAVSEDDLIFESKYAPMVITEMTPEEIEKAAQNPDIESISYYYEQEAKCCTSTLAEMKSINGFTAAYQKTGLTGKGVKVGIADIAAITANSELPASRFTPIGSQNNNWHAKEMAYISTGNNGIAPGATVYSIGELTTNDLYHSVETLIDKNVNVINHSVTFPYNNDSTRANDIYDALEKWIDHIATNHNVTFTQCACNEALTKKYIESPGLAYNVITVGAIDDKGTASQTDDMLGDFSSYGHGTGCYKPDIAVIGYIRNCAGTSGATAVVTGIVALMMELKPSLKAYPETIKAILLASCHRKVIDPVSHTQTEFMTSGLTNKQGAGVVDIFSVINIISKNQYASGTFSGTTLNRTITIPYERLSYANISLAWLRNNKISGSNHENTGNVSVGTKPNLNLAVYYNSTLLRSSNNQTSSTELAYFPLRNSTSYKLTISESNSTANSVYYAYAWSTMADQGCPKGDANLDYTVTLSDAQQVLNYTQSSASINSLQQYLMDYNKDGVINSTDVQLIQNKALGIN